MKRSKILKIILSVTMVLVLLVAVGLLPINLWFAKGTIERYARENLNVDLVIQGTLRVRLGRSARLDAMAIRASKLGAENAALVQIAALSANADLLELLRGNVHLGEFRIEGANVDYCAALPTIELAGSDTQLSPSTNADTSIAVDSFSVTNLQVHCGDQQDEQAPSIFIAELSGSAPTEEVIALSVIGRVNDTPVQIDAQGGNLNALLTSIDGFPLHLEVTAEGAEFSLSGEFNEVFEKLELQVDSSLRMQNPQKFLANIGIAVPDIPDFEASLQARLNEEAIEFESFEAQIGENDIRGTAEARFSSDRNYYAMDVHIGQFDTASFESDADQSNVSSGSKPLDLQPIFSSLRSFDGRAQIVADNLIVGGVQLESVALEANLGGGTLEIAQLKMDVLGGSVEATAGLDLQSECEQFSSQARVSNIDLDRLAEIIEQEIPLTGGIGTLQLQAESCGSSLTALKNSALLEIEVSGASLNYRSLDIPASLKTLTLHAGWSDPTRASIQGHAYEEPLSIDLQGGTVEELLAGDPWPIDLDLRGAGASVAIDGNVAVGNTAMIDLSLKLDVPRVGTLHRLIGVDSESKLPLSANTVLNWNSEQLSIDDINVSAGNSALSGRIESIVVDQEKILVTELRSERLDIIELKEVFGLSDEDTASSPQLQPIDETKDQAWFLPTLNLPSVDLDIAIARIDVPNFEINDIEIRGHARDQLIDGAGVKMRIDDLLLEGKFDLDLRDQLRKFSYQASAANLDVSSLLQRLNMDIDAEITAQLMTVDYDTSGTTLQEVATNGVVNFEVQDLKWQRAATDVDLRVEKFAVTAAPGQTTVWNTHGTIGGVPLNVRGEMPPLGDIIYGNKTTQLTVAANSGDVAGMFSGVLDWSNPDQFSGELTLSSQRMESETIDLSMLQSPLQGIVISTKLAISDQELIATNLRASIGTSSVTGSIKVWESELGRELEIRLQAPHIQSLDLIPIVNEWSAHKPKELDEGPAVDAEQRDIRNVFWEFVDAQKQGGRIDVQIEIDDVRAGDELMGGAQIGLLVDKDNFRLQPFSVSLPSGDIDIEYVEEAVGDVYESYLNMYVERLQYGDLVQLYDPDAPKDMRGLVYLDTSLTANASSVSELRKALQGEVKLLIIPEDIGAGVLDLWAANLIVSILTPEDVGDPKKLNCMVAQFEVDKGVMKSKTVMLDSTDIIVRGKGQIDLENRTIDLVAAPQAKLEKFLSMSTPITVTGPWDDMQIGVGGAGFIGTLFRWYMSIIYVPFKWITGDRFPEDGLETCFASTDWEYVSD